MTKLEELIQSDKIMISPAVAAPVLGIDPQALRIMARTEPEKLGFPVMVTGHKTSIPRIPLLRFLGVNV